MSETPESESHTWGRATCPHCGEKRGKKTARYKTSQYYQCAVCRKRWRGDLAPPPYYPCPYCKGPCHKRGTRPDRSAKKMGRRSSLAKWLDRSMPAPPSPPRVQMYNCTKCGRTNSELWPVPPVTPHAPGRRQYPHRVTLCLNAAAEDALAAYCYKHKINAAQAVRAIFAAAYYPNFLRARKNFGKSRPPHFPPDTPVPPLADGRIAECEKRRGKLFGHHEVIITKILPVNLDAVSYLSLLRMMGDGKMTRQEAARLLLTATVPKFIGQWTKSDDDW